MLNKLHLCISVITLWFISVGTLAQTEIIDTLENRRNEIVFPELTSDQKRVLSEQAQFLLKDLYVHRFEKLAFYPGLEDPVPQIANIVENADSLSTAEIEEGIYRIFAAQRDLHLNYLFPEPHASYRSFLPLTFTRTANFFDRFEVRVSAVNADLFAEYAPGQQVPELGDRIVAYDGLSIDAAVERQKQTAQGANEFGGFTRALGQMTFVSHFLHLKPERDTISITFEKSTRSPYFHGRRYTITLPWLVQFTAPEEVRSLNAPETKKKFDPKRFNEAREVWQEEYNDFVRSVGLEETSDYPNLPTAEPVLTWGRIENRYGEFGYLRLTSFVPQTGVANTIAEIRRLLLEEFDDTDGLIFDVRNNGGGFISLADELSQLFMPNEADVIKARLLNTELNLSVFNDNVFGPNVLGENWNQVINEAAGNGELYTELAAFTTDSAANSRGQAYFKPVAVLANARSYSASDLFVCSMKDNRAALVFGEDLRTGAGGANVVNHGSFFNVLLPSVFEPLPPGHDMRVSWRQSVRFGPAAGRIIEDFGCEANIDVSRTPRDLLQGNRDQIKTITRELGVKSNFFRYQPSARTANSRLNQLTLGDTPVLEVSVKYTPLISVSVGGVEKDLIPVFASKREEKVEVDLSTLPINAQSQVVLRGVTWSGRTLWNLKRNITRLDQKLPVDDAGLLLDFSSLTDLGPLAVVNANTAAENGWQLVPPALQVGFEPSYLDNINTSGILALNLSALNSATLSIDFEQDTELDFDFFEVFIADENGVPEQQLQRSSGQQSRRTVEFDLSAFAGRESVLIYFQFISDGFVTAPGIKIYSIKLNANETIQPE
ncbi:MAG: hypothetical protein KTR17_00855 [Cellvibrionaceae bacterium]|nr:hypothetical protein [Cellvibrionaceae bacterium]